MKRALPPATESHVTAVRAGLVASTAALHDGDSSSIDLVVSVRRTNIVLQQLVDAYSKRHGLSASRSKILMRLHGAPKHTLPASQLAESLSVTRGNITFLLKELREDGLIAIESDPNDGRYSMVRLTPAGMRKIRSYAPSHYAALALATGGLTPPEKRQLLKLLDKLRLHAIGVEEDAVAIGSASNS